MKLNNKLNKEIVLYQDFILQLRKYGFLGDIEEKQAELLLKSLDNSIYQMIPILVVYPKSEQDLKRFLECFNQQCFAEISLSIRGGGTSTIGQSLSHDCVLDLSRYLNKIKDFELDKDEVIVESGVVLSDLVAYLNPYDKEFPIDISSSSAATIGGMVNTDASGSNSLIMGRMHNHVVEIRGFLIDGSEFKVKRTSLDNLSKQTIINGIPSSWYLAILRSIRENSNEISQLFSSTIRGLSGYNIKDVIDEEICCSLIPVLCGSEGTLAIITEVKLNIVEKKQYKKLLVIIFDDFLDSICAIDLMNEIAPSAIEVMDDHLVGAAQKNKILFSVVDQYFKEKADKIQGMVLVEFKDDDLRIIKDKISEFKALVRKKSGYLAMELVDDVVDQVAFFNLRNKSVGIVASTVVDNRRAVPFIEDTSVPIACLRQYIGDVKEVLDRYQLSYGIYGHLDVGCLHIRPCLDLSIIEDNERLDEILDKVFVIVKKYNGSLRAEHGYGMLSVYNEKILGERLYGIMCMIKRLFDPNNRLNPGKVATAEETSQKIVDFRQFRYAKKYAKIADKYKDKFSNTIACNGNASCLNTKDNMLICPSYRATHDMMQSPRGRSILFRDWLLHRKELTTSSSKCKYSFNVINVIKRIVLNFKKSDMDWYLHKSMQGCLGCKGCNTQCPVRVSIPKAKDEFSAYYARRYKFFYNFNIVSYFEIILVFLSRLPKMIKVIINSSVVKWVAKVFFRYSYIPSLSLKSWKNMVDESKIVMSDDALLVDNKPMSIVVIVLDAFTLSYSPDVIISLVELLRKINLSCCVVPFVASGMAANNVGDVVMAERYVKVLSEKLTKIYSSFENVDFVCIEPSVTLYLKNDCSDYGSSSLIFKKMLLPQELLMKHNDAICELDKVEKSASNFCLLTHCNEKMEVASAATMWSDLFKNARLNLKSMDVGCCGMAGNYGLQKKNLVNSMKLYDKSYKIIVENNENSVLSTGFSCREQIRRFSAVEVLHPLVVLNQSLIEGAC